MPAPAPDDRDPQLVVLGQVLADLRGERTQEDIALTLGTSPAAISFLENGQRSPNYRTLRRHVDVLGVTFTEFAQRVEALERT